jgi:hypothetical protein
VSNDFQPIGAKGGNGQIYFDEKQVKIIRDGFAGRMTVGKGAKSIPLSSITAVRFRGASLGIKGFAQFSIMGDVSVRGNLSSAHPAKPSQKLLAHSLYVVLIPPLIGVGPDSFYMRSCGLRRFVE